VFAASTVFGGLADVPPDKDKSTKDLGVLNIAGALPSDRGDVDHEQHAADQRTSPHVVRSVLNT
jgi:hypothetical protein